MNVFSLIPPALAGLGAEFLMAQMLHLLPWFAEWNGWVSICGGATTRGACADNSIALLVKGNSPVWAAIYNRFGITPAFVISAAGGWAACLYVARKRAAPASRPAMLWAYAACSCAMWGAVSFVNLTNSIVGLLMPLGVLYESLHLAFNWEMRGMAAIGSGLAHIAVEMAAVMFVAIAFNAAMSYISTKREKQ